MRNPDPDWEIYIEQFISRLDPLLDELENYTRWHTPYPQMLSGKWQAAFLHFLVRLKQPRRVLEIGTFTGYATLAMAQALPDGSKIITLENHPENLSIARRFFRKSKFGHKIEAVETQAPDWLSRNNEKYDLVFLDADKENYPRYYQIIKKRLNPGAWWITDNVLWNGKVLNPGRDPQARAIAAFNESVRRDPQLETMLIPLRDGLLWTVYRP
jgi:predicted O-methyltransferase YrrM